MSTPDTWTRTNGDMIAPAVAQVKKIAGQLAAHFRENPDEAAVALAPWLMLAAATRRHKLNFAEAALVSEVAFWAGVFAVHAYQDWKAQDAIPFLRSVK
jgi:hypothetical protein